MGALGGPGWVGMHAIRSALRWCSKFCGRLKSYNLVTSWPTCNKLSIVASRASPPDATGFFHYRSSDQGIVWITPNIVIPISER